MEKDDHQYKFGNHRNYNTLLSTINFKIKTRQSISGLYIYRILTIFFALKSRITIETGFKSSLSYLLK